MAASPTVIDLFAGGGGTSTGTVQSFQSRGHEKITLTALNHDRYAIETHRINYPWATHYQQDIKKVNPTEVADPYELDLLVAAPSCQGFSVARGGKVMSKKTRESREQAQSVAFWMHKLKPRAVLVENVSEFQKWGAIDSNDNPIKEKKGLMFKAWLQGIAKLGYAFEYRILNAADYGDPTTRRRFFMIAIRQDITDFSESIPHISWPIPSHSKSGSPTTAKWRSAREVLRLDIHGESIFNPSPNTASGRRMIDTMNKTGLPLSIRTMERIYAGLVKFSSPEIQPFILSQASGGSPRNIDDPVMTIPTAGKHALIEPYILPKEGYFRGNLAKSIKEPLGTILAGREYGHLIEPFIVKYYKSGGNIQETNIPLPTLTTKDRIGFCEPFLLPYHGERKGQDLRIRSINEPMPTVTTVHNLSLIQPSIKINGSTYMIDIRYRMLLPEELAAAMSFPKSYRFAGPKGEVTKQIGNAVAVSIARSLIGSIIDSLKIGGI